MGRVVRMAEHAFGWPLPMLSFSEVHLPDPGKDTTIRTLRRIGVDESGFARHEWTVARILNMRTFAASAGVFMAPTRLLITFAAINSVLYGVAWLLVFAVLIGVPRTIRRALRRRAGRCVKCGYDLRAGTSPVCPECGRMRC